MNSHLVPEMSDNCVAYRDVGEERKQGAASFEVLANSLLQGESRSERRPPGGCTLRLVLEHFRHNLLRSDSIRGSLSYRV